MISAFKKVLNTEDSSISNHTAAGIVDVLSTFVSLKTGCSSVTDFQTDFASVSSDPTLKSECWKGAKFLASLLESIGAETKIVEG